MPRKKIAQEKIDAAYAALEFAPLDIEPSDRMDGVKGPTRIMYIERKAGELTGDARIGRVTFSKTKKTVYYSGKAFQSLKGGYKANYFETKSGDEYWISGPKKDGSDRLYGERIPINIDDDSREEYWVLIRKEAKYVKRTTA